MPRANRRALALSVLVWSLAACGPRPTEGLAPPPVSTPAPPAPSAAPPPSTTPVAPPPPVPSASAPETPPKAPAGKAVRPTAMGARLAAIGIDVNKAPDLAKLSSTQKKKVMPLLQEALGYASCDGCHVGSDYAANTRNKRVTSAMWSRFLGPLRDAHGEALFCDSCHQGAAEILDRSDPGAVNAFMEAEYEDHLTRADGKRNGCTSCHGDTMETSIIATLWGIQK